MLVFIICLLLCILVAKLVPGVIGAILSGIFIIASMIGFVAMFGFNKFAIIFVVLVLYVVGHVAYLIYKDSKK